MVGKFFHIMNIFLWLFFDNGRGFFFGFGVFNVNVVLCDWCILHLIFSVNLLLDKLLGVILRGSSIF